MYHFNFNKVPNGGHNPQISTTKYLIGRDRLVNKTADKRNPPPTTWVFGKVLLISLSSIALHHLKKYVTTVFASDIKVLYYDNESLGATASLYTWNSYKSHR